jgi:transposase
MAMVFIGVDPHKLSATIEVVDDREKVLATGRFATDRGGYAAMCKQVAAWPEREWAVEGSNGAGRPLAQRLLADGQHVVDVPAKLSARARLFDTGHNRKTDAHDAQAVAVVAVRTAGLRVLSYDEELGALRMMSDRRAELARHRVQTINRLHRLLSELKPGISKKDLTALQAKAILASVRPRDLPGKTRRRLAAELLAELCSATFIGELSRWIDAPPNKWDPSKAQRGLATAQPLDRLALLGSTALCVVEHGLNSLGPHAPAQYGRTDL